MDIKAIAVAKSYTDKIVSETGVKGKDGISVTKTEINNKGELVITLSDNTVSNLGVVVGAKGDKGDKGDQGEQGVSGVYVGSGDMPEGYNVQIDPDGEALEVVTKEEFQQFSETVTNNNNISTKHFNNTDIHVTDEEKVLWNNKGGENVTGKIQTDSSGNEYTGGTNAERFNGDINVAKGEFSHAEGYKTIASGDYSHSEGHKALASGARSHAEGNLTKSTAAASHAEGDSTKSTAAASHAEGYNTTASGIYSHAEGYTTTASGICSHAEGYTTTANGNYSHAEGKNGVTYGLYSHIEGRECVAGDSTDTTKGECAHAEGYKCEAIGISSHAEGRENLAEGESSHAEGYLSQSIGIVSHAEGRETLAKGYASHTEGYGTVTTGNSVHAQGKYNIIDETGKTFAHIVGNGSTKKVIDEETGETVTKINRSNAHTLNWNGEAWFAKSVTSTQADYAEYYEWVDGNPNNEDRVGLLVTLDGEKIKLANEGNDILGIVSGTAAIIGDNYEWEWKNKYLTDDFGRIIYEEIEETVIDIIEVLDPETGDVIIDIETGKPIMKEITLSLGKRKIPKINPEFDFNKEYISRENRPEWDVIGLLGKLFVRDDGTATVNGYITVGKNGIATASTEKTNMRVLSRVKDNIIKVQKQ